MLQSAEGTHVTLVQQAVKVLIGMPIRIVFSVRLCYRIVDASFIHIRSDVK
jgi:hypothetical protein